MKYIDGVVKKLHKHYPVRFITRLDGTFHQCECRAVKKLRVGA